MRFLFRWFFQEAWKEGWEQGVAYERLRAKMEEQAFRELIQVSQELGLYEDGEQA